MAPMVATVAEAAEFAEKVRARGLKPGVMVEIPSAALLAHRMLEVVDFLSIGTNDLTQYAMAADRMATDLAHLTDPWQPAVLQLIAITADAGKRPASRSGSAARPPPTRCSPRALDRDGHHVALDGRPRRTPRRRPARRASRWTPARQRPRPRSVPPTRWPLAPPCGRCSATEAMRPPTPRLRQARPAPGDLPPTRGAGDVPGGSVHLTTEETMTSAYDRYRAADLDLPEETWAWNLWGAGEENMGKDGRPELLPVPSARCRPHAGAYRQRGPLLLGREDHAPGRQPPEALRPRPGQGAHPARARGEPHRHRGRRQPEGPLPRRPAAGRAARHLPGRQEHGLRLHHPRRSDPVPPDGRGDARHRRRCLPAAPPRHDGVRRGVHAGAVGLRDGRLHPASPPGAQGRRDDVDRRPARGRARVPLLLRAGRSGHHRDDRRARLGGEARGGHLGHHGRTQRHRHRRLPGAGGRADRRRRLRRHRRARSSIRGDGGCRGHAHRPAGHPQPGGRDRPRRPGGHRRGPSALRLHRLPRRPGSGHRRLLRRGAQPL